MRISDWSSDVCSSDLTAQARTNAERSLALNPKLADGFIALGFSDYYGRLDYDAALTAFATAQRLRPNDAGAMAAASYVYRRQGRIADAIRKQEERSEEHTSELQSLMRISYAVVCLKQQNETAQLI